MQRSLSNRALFSNPGGRSVGSIVTNISNGSQPGNFGWLTWAGSPSVPTLVSSLTPPGNSATYVNPDASTDHQVSVGDWIQSTAGVSDSKNVRDALDVLTGVDVIVPVWNQTRGQGGTAAYRVSAFARVRLLSYQLPNANRITVRFLGYTTCGIQNTAPVVSAGGDQTVFLPGLATLNGSVTDDGLPGSGALSVSWTQVNGPGNVTFNNPASAITTASFSAAGNYVVRLTASDTQLTTSNQASLSIKLANRAPVAIPQSRATNEDTSLDLTLIGTDADGDPLTFTIVTSPISRTIVRHRSRSALHSEP